MIASYEGQTVIDTCEAFMEYRWNAMDFTWYASTDECVEYVDYGDCLPEIIDYVDAQGCYYENRVDHCEGVEYCLAVIEIDGMYYPGECEELAAYFDVPYEQEEETEVEEEEVEEVVFESEWASCMEMYVMVPEVTRCQYKETETECMAVGTMNDVTIFGTCDQLIAQVEAGALEWEDVTEGCEIIVQASCMDDEDIASFAEFCHYINYENFCTEEAEYGWCYAVVTVDGVDHVGSCDYLEEFFMADDETEAAETEETDDAVEEDDGEGPSEDEVPLTDEIVEDEPTEDETATEDDLLVELKQAGHRSTP